MNARSVTKTFYRLLHGLFMANDGRIQVMAKDKLNYGDCIAGIYQCPLPDAELVLGGGEQFKELAVFHPDVGDGISYFKTRIYRASISGGPSSIEISLGYRPDESHIIQRLTNDAGSCVLRYVIALSGEGCMNRKPDPYELMKDSHATVVQPYIIVTDEIKTEQGIRMHAVKMAGILLGRPESRDGEEPPGIAVFERDGDIYLLLYPDLLYLLNGMRRLH